MLKHLIKIVGCWNFALTMLKKHERYDKGKKFGPKNHKDIKEKVIYSNCTKPSHFQ